VQQWISQLAVDGYTHATIRAKKSLLKTILQVAVAQGWLADNVVDRARLPKAVEQPDEDRVITPEEWAQIRLQLSGEGTLLLCDLTLDCGLRFEEVTALRPMDVSDGDERNASHVWIRQAVTWPGRVYTGGPEPWLLGPTKGKPFRKVAVSPPVSDRLRRYGMSTPTPVARRRWSSTTRYCARSTPPAWSRTHGRCASPPAGTSARSPAGPVRTARRTPTPSGAAACTAATPTPRRGSGPAERRALDPTVRSAVSSGLPSDSIVLGCRPEYLRLGAATNAPTFEAAVDRLELLGNERVLHLRAGVTGQPVDSWAAAFLRRPCRAFRRALVGLCRGCSPLNAGERRSHSAAEPRAATAGRARREAANNDGLPAGVARRGVTAGPAPVAPITPRWLPCRAGRR